MSSEPIRCRPCMAAGSKRYKRQQKPAVIRNGKRAYVKEFRNICEEMLGDTAVVIAVNNTDTSLVIDFPQFKFCSCNH